MSGRAIGVVALFLGAGACASAAYQGSPEVARGSETATEAPPLEVTLKRAPAATNVVSPPPPSVSAAPTPSSAEASGNLSARPTATNQIPLGDATMPFASYIVAMHQGIHKQFAEGLLVELDKLGTSDKLNDPALITTLEIELTGKTGGVKRIGIIRSSGVTAFDAAVLDRVLKAAPFGPAPESIRSRDGDVYVHWSFHRDPFTSCSTVGAIPFLLARP